MEPYTVEQVRKRMANAWDGISYLSAKATIKYFGAVHHHAQHPAFLQPADVDRPIYRLQAWWRRPDQWRHDRDDFNGTTVSYIGVGDQWCLGKNGVLERSGTIEEARNQRLTQEGLLFYGRPYLTPEDNAHLWLWLNPAIWVASFQFALNNWYAPPRDDVFEDAQVVHVLAGEGLPPNFETSEQRAQLRRWWIAEWDRDEELGDYANFFQLWVDMRTGFCRRMTSEGANGRQWDIIVESLALDNVAQVPDAVFRGFTAATE